MDPAKLAAGEPHVRKQIDEPALIRSAPDDKRGRRYFDLVFDAAGVPPSPERDAALDELRTYHATHNLWEVVPPDVVPALERLRRLGLQLAVVSNANGTLRAKFERVGLARRVDCVIDSAEVGNREAGRAHLRVRARAARRTPREHAACRRHLPRRRRRRPRGRDSRDAPRSARSVRGIPVRARQLAGRSRREAIAGLSSSFRIGATGSA